MERAHEDIQTHLAPLAEVIVRYRKSLNPGRFSTKTESVMEITDHNRDADAIMVNVCQHAAAIEKLHGDCTFQLTCMLVDADGVTHESPPIVFSSADDHEGAVQQGDVAGLVSTLTRTNQRLAQQIARDHDDMGKVMGMFGTYAEGMAKMTAANAEADAVRFEHEREEKREQRESDKDLAELSVFERMASRWMVLQAAKEAKETMSQQTGTKEPAWKRLRTVARQILPRPAVRNLLGEDGVDLVDAIAMATSRDLVAQPLEELTAMVKRGDLEPTAFISICPELLPFADMFMGNEPMGEE